MGNEQTIDNSQLGKGAALSVSKGYKNTEVGVIPEDWETCKLEEIAMFSSGSTPRREFHERYFINGTVSWVKTMDLNNSRILHTSEKITDIALKETSSLKVFPLDTILVAMYGGFNQIGRTGILKVNACVNQAITAIKPDLSKLDSTYLLYYLNLKVDYWKDVATSSRKDPNITSKDVKCFPISLPPIKEQTAIATVLSETDSLIQGLEKKIAKKQLIKKGAMQKLLTPKDGWDYIRLGGIASMNSGGTPLTTNSKYYGGDIIWVSISDISDAGKYISNSIKKINEEGLANSSARLFKSGTVLLAMYASIGKCCIATEEVTTSQAILGITPSQKLLNEYLYYYLVFKVSELISQGQQGTQSNLNKGIVEDYQIHLPNIEEQTHIAQILSDMDTEIETIKKKLGKYKQLKQGLMQNLLTGKIRLV